MHTMSRRDYHAFRIKDRCFILDVERSFLYSVRPDVFEVIIGDEESLHNLNKLPFYERWLLKNELRNLKRKIKPLSEKKRKKELARLEQGGEGLNGIWLGVSHACNLGCSYCFANDPEYVGKNKLMKRETAIKSVDYLIENSGDREVLTVIFFGGEPLLNLPVIKETVAYCREREKDTHKRFQFTMTTNGTLLTREVFETLRELKINTMVSMDGLPEIHNTYRKMKSGEPSWDIIVNNLKSIPNFGDYLSVRATVVEDDIDLVKCITTLQDIGFKTISFGQVCSNSGTDTTQDHFSMDTWKKRNDELVDYYIDTAESIQDIPVRNFRSVINNIYFRSRQLFCCATGRYYYYIDPDGDIYPCARLITQDSDQRLGTLDDTSCIEEKSRAFFTRNVYRTMCRDCWARYLCGGPCFGDSHFIYGDLETPDPMDCEKKKYLIYLAAYILDYYTHGNTT